MGPPSAPTRDLLVERATSWLSDSQVYPVASAGWQREEDLCGSPVERCDDDVLAVLPLLFDHRQRGRVLGVELDFPGHEHPIGLGDLVVNRRRVERARSGDGLEQDRGR